MENNENNQNEKNNEKTEIKSLFLVGIMTFLGAFLAFYVLMHQTMIHFYKSKQHFPMINSRPFNKFEKQMENIERDFDNFEKREIKQIKNKISAVQTLKYDDAYVIVVNLKPFNNNEDNIRFSLNGNVATISGNVVKNKRNGDNAYYFNESFEIPEKININAIEKEKVDGKYIITLPIEN